MSMQRHITRTVTVAPLSPGFIGPGHLASMVLSPDDFERNDPFFLLMDDHLDLGDRPVGGAHPHAGFETVTFLLEGAVRVRYEGGELAAGDLQWMTAGRGIIHSESVEARGKVRLLQLWLILPKRERWTAPGFQDVPLAGLPVRREPGVELRLYSGSSGGLRSPTRNHVPVTIADIRLDRGATVTQELPASYNGFLYVLEGEVRVGDELESASLSENQTGWLDRPVVAPITAGESVISLRAGPRGARVLLYAGQPQRDRIVASGPFIGDTREDIARLTREYHSGRFARMSELASAAQRG